MKAGDLVKLSAAGEKLSVCNHARDKIGLVVDKQKRKIKERKKDVEVYIVNWTQGRSGAEHLRSDLKFVSRVKK